MRIDREYMDEYLKGVLKPGSVIVSYGMRGGGKTHTAISFCQECIENRISTTPKHVVLITNVIFVKRTRDGFVTESPPGVHTIHQMREIFPIVVDTVHRYGRKDTMVILLLDEAQNFLLGDMNNVGDMAASMKKFCGIIRKFNLCLWLISPAMRNLGPAFRNFLDADNDPGNVNVTFQKNNAEAQRFISQRHLDLDPRGIVFAKAGAKEPVEYVPVPKTSWTSDPETLKVGEYAYDHLSSADFVVGDFPFHEFVQYISGKSSYEMLEGITEFYDMLESSEEAPAEDGRMTEMQVVRTYYKRLLDAGVEKKLLGEVFQRDIRTLDKWAGIETKRKKP